MVVGASAPYIADVELPAIANAGWLRWLNEDIAGSPNLIPDTSTSGNLVHHAYHLLRFWQACGVAASDFTQVTEIGAGYGSMARLLSRLAPSQPAITLVDLPEFSALQRYYLSLVGVDAATVSADAVKAANGGLLIATWSLSEMPRSDAEALLQRLGVFDAYLIAYQHQFGELDNAGFFRRLINDNPDVDWVEQDIPHLQSSRYLFGVNPIV
jgi:hypothetical protein